MRKVNATVAELADAQRSGRCLVYPSAGSTPVSGIELAYNIGLWDGNIPQIGPKFKKDALDRS